MSKLPTAALAIALAGLVAGCRGEEQGRPVAHEKGVYLGQKDTSLDEERRRALRERTLLGH